MPMIAAAVDTPYYLLRDQNRSIRPHCIPSEMEWSAVYGFSSQTLYDAFRNNSPLALVPYPLVKVYLQNQVSESVAGARLLVLDAAGPDEPTLQAATMEAVLAAHESRTKQVVVTHHLTFDQAGRGYRLEVDSV